MADDDMPVIAVLGRTADGRLEPLEELRLAEDQEIVVLPCPDGIVVVCGEVTEVDVPILEAYGAEVVDGQDS